MRDSRCFRAWFVGNIAACCLLATARSSGGAEEAWRFLEGLRERGYYDMAQAYLEQIRQSPQCPEDLKEVIDYQMGITLVAGSRLAGSLRQQQLDQARDAFQAFLDEHPGHSLAADANTQLANVLIEQGKVKVELASRPSKSEQEKKQLMAAARQQYEEAQKVFVDAEKRVYERAKVLEQEAETDPDKVELRDQCRGELLDARLCLATVIYEIGKTYEPDSEAFKKNLNDAAKKYNELYEKYQKWGGGLYARMQEARMYKDLGQTDKAIAVLQELRGLVKGDAGARNLSNETLIVLLDTYLLPSVKKYEEAIAEAQEWQESARGAEESSPVGLQIRFLAGKASLALAEGLKKADDKRREALRAARQHFQFVTRFPGELRLEAGNMLAHELLGGEGDIAVPKTFAEAKERGDFSWATMVAVRGSLLNAETKEDQEKFTAEFNEARDQALEYYTMALGLRTAETRIDELNLIRSYLTYLYWFSNDFYRAAMMGEFLARRYPQAAGARPAAGLAVKAYRTLYLQSPKRKEERTFETRRMTSIAEYIASRWPDQPETNEARKYLLETAIDSRDVQKAEEYLATIPPDSPLRAEAELRTGQALWGLYVEESNKKEDRLPQDKLDEMVANAQQTLEQGIARTRAPVDEGGAVDYTLVYSVLSLAKICIGAGNSEAAVTWLEDPKIGPMTLVTAKHPATDKENFRIETYKAALQAYVGVQQLDKAEKAMGALEAEVAASGDASAVKRLTEVYYDLGRELQETLTRLRQENRTQEAEGVTRGFEMFLDRVSKRGEDFNSLNWVAGTYFNLGASLDPEGQQAPEEATRHYRAAFRTYVKILGKIKEDRDFAPPGVATGIQVRLALCLRALDKHAEALEILAKMLEQNPLRVSVQVEAAHTYQDWAGTKGQSAKYLSAIKGANVNGKYLIWGWAGIGKRTANLPNFEPTFHEARYNLALCRFRLAQTQRGAEKAETLKEAEQDITRVHLLYPRMGGDEWFRKYDSLLKTIQRLRGVRNAPGLDGLPKR